MHTEHSNQDASKVGGTTMVAHSAQSMPLTCLQLRNCVSPDHKPDTLYCLAFVITVEKNLQCLTCI